jgi:hypothetical protein
MARGKTRRRRERREHRDATNAGRSHVERDKRDGPGRPQMQQLGFGVDSHVEADGGRWEHTH